MESALYMRVPTRFASRATVQPIPPFGSIRPPIPFPSPLNLQSISLHPPSPCSMHFFPTGWFSLPVSPAPPQPRVCDKFHKPTGRIGDCRSRAVDGAKVNTLRIICRLVVREGPKALFQVARSLLSRCLRMISVYG